MKPSGLFLATSLVALTIASAAQAAPDSLQTTMAPGGAILSGFDVSREGFIAIAGSTIDMGNMFSPFRAHAIYGTTSSLNDISGDLSNTSSMSVTGGATSYGATVWIARGDQVFRRGASSWTSASAPAKLNALRAFSAERIVGVGDGGTAAVSTDSGQTWVATPTGTDADLKGMFWRSDSEGWAWGATVTKESDPFGEGGDVRRVGAAALLHTTDGGTSWSAIHTATGITFGPAFFLADGRTGWLATSTLSSDSNDAAAALLHTTDGGANWSPVALPASVGTLKSPFSSQDIDLSTIVSIWWDDASNGRLFAVAHLFDATSSESGGSGSGTKDETGWMIIELTTSDAGKTWAHDELGTIEMTISFGGNSIEHDGAIYQGTALSWSRHMLLAADRIWFTKDWGDDPRGDTGGSTNTGASGSSGDGGSTGNGSGIVAVGGDDSGSGDDTGRRRPGSATSDSSDGEGCCATADIYGASAVPFGAIILLLLVLQRSRARNRSVPG